jgi:hypothetical protein
MFIAEAATPNYLWLHPPSGDHLSQQEQPLDEGGVEVVFTARDIPGLRPDVFSLPGTTRGSQLLMYYGSYRSEAAFWSFLARAASSWIEEWEKDFEQLDTWAARLTDLPTNEAKIASAFRILTDRIEPDEHVYLRRGLNSEINVNRAIRDGRGTSFEMSIYLWRLLRRSGVDAGLAFLRDRRTGAFVREAKFWQFTSVIVIAKDDQRRDVYCAPGERGTGPGRLPWYFEGVDALLLNDWESGFRRLVSSRAEENHSKTELALRIEDSGDLAGDFEWTRTGHSADGLRQALADVDPRSAQPTVLAELESQFPGATFEQVELGGLESPGGPLTVRARVVIGGAIGSWGSRSSIRPLALPVVGPRAIDFSEQDPIELPFPFMETLSVRIHVDDGTTVDLLPAGSDRQGFAGLARSTFDWDGSEVVAQRFFRIDHASFEPRHARLVKQLFEERQRSQELMVVLNE